MIGELERRIGLITGAGSGTIRTSSDAMAERTAMKRLGEARTPTGTGNWVSSERAYRLNLRSRWQPSRRVMPIMRIC